MRKKTFLPIALLFVVSCAPTLPLIKMDSLPLPQSFSAESQNPADFNVSNGAWQAFFNDSKLVSLIDTACKHNQDLSMLEQEISIANNEIMARQGEYLPKLGFKGNVGSEQEERFSAPDANGPTQFGSVGLTTVWEIDIWKKLRNAAKSAYFKYLSSVEGRRYLITNLVAEVSSAYFELMALDNQLKIVEDYIEVMSKVKSSVELQQRAGRVTSLAVKRYEAEVLKNQARRFQIEQQIVFVQNKLNFLLGRFPQHIDRDPRRFSSYGFAKMYTSVPSKLLENRPDIKQANLALEAEKLNVEVAKARFYPALTLEGGAGYEQFNSAHFAAPATSLFYGLAAGITAPLLNRKAIRAEYFSANNRQIAAVYNYEQTLIKAYTEVVNQLTNLKNLSGTLELKEKQVKVLNDAVDVAFALFKAARVDYIETLLAQRDALDSQVELAEIKKQQLTAMVSLYKALGGGWKGLDSTRTSEW